MEVDYYNNAIMMEVIVTYTTRAGGTTMPRTLPETAPMTCAGRLGNNNNNNNDSSNNTTTNNNTTNNDNNNTK